MGSARILFLSILLSALVCGTAAADYLAGYKVLKRVPVPGDMGWDCLTLDSQARKLYLSHDTEVVVLDADSLKVIGQIRGLHHCHGIALAPQFNRGFITSGEDGLVAVFDLKTLKVVRKVPAQKGADGILFDPATRQVFSFNGEPGNATVIGARSLKVFKTLDLGGKPESAAANGKGQVFDCIEDKDEVAVIDSKGLKVAQRWPTAPGKSPAGMAIDPVNHRLFIGCHNELMVIMDSTNGKVIKTLPIGKRIDATAYDQDRGVVYNSCGDGTLSVVHAETPDRYWVVENAKTELGARTMAVDLKTGHVVLATAETLPPPTPTADNPKPRPRILPDTFHLLVVGQ